VLAGRDFRASTLTLMLRQRLFRARSLLIVVAVSCLLLADGCGSDESQATEKSVPVGGWRTDPSRTVGEPEQPGSPTPSDAVFTPDERGSLAYRPTIIRGEDGGGIYSIRWKTYGGRTASGVGILSNGQPVTIRLGARSECAGRRAYLQWAVNPAGSRNKPEFSDIMSPHTWNDACNPEHPEPEG
jgi:hypothetical protein